MIKKSTYLIFILFSFFLANANPIVVHNETFNACGSITWTAIDFTDATDVWTCTQEGTSSNYYMDINGFGGSNDEDWLISPSINMDTQEEEYFIFYYYDIFNGNDIELVYSTDFSGTMTQAAVNSATWTNLPLDLVDISDLGCGSNFFRHPSIDISGISGTSVYFAFRYTGTSSSAENWRIDEISITANYYSTVHALAVSGQDCGTLKTSLHELIDDHFPIRYTSSLFDVWDAMGQTDTRMNDLNNALIVWDMFSDQPGGPEAYEYDECSNRDTGGSTSTEGTSFNREHTLPRSWWGGGTSYPSDTQNTDMHHLFPSDKFLNQEKSNFAPANVTTAAITGSNGFKIGTSTSGAPDAACTGDEYWEPIDEYKGDYARTFFYLATRYEHEITTWASTTTNSIDDCALNTDPATVFEPWLLSTLVAWHFADPVSTKEIERNNAVYSIQGNRNPYIDHPEYVGAIWGNPATGETCTDLALPVELTNFSGRAEQHGIVLNWTTLSEINSSGFEIEHSTDGVRFSQAGHLAAAGFSEEILKYQFFHKTPETGMNYYRLKMVDLDDSFEYSKTISIKWGKRSELHIFPTISQGELNVRLPEGFDQGELQVFSLEGKMIFAQTFEQTNDLIRLDVSRLSSGHYSIIVRANNQTRVGRFYKE